MYTSLWEFILLFFPLYFIHCLLSINDHDQQTRKYANQIGQSHTAICWVSSVKVPLFAPGPWSEASFSPPFLVYHGETHAYVWITDMLLGNTVLSLVEVNGGSRAWRAHDSKVKCSSLYTLCSFPFSKWSLAPSWARGVWWHLQNFNVQELYVRLWWNQQVILSLLAHPTGQDHCSAPGSPWCFLLVGSVAKALGYCVWDVVPLQAAFLKRPRTRAGCYILTCRNGCWLLYTIYCWNRQGADPRLGFQG